MRNPFAGTIDWFGGKYDESQGDTTMSACTYREAAQELGISREVIERIQLQLIGVLICYNKWEETRNFRVPIYAGEVQSKDELAFQQASDGMQDIWRHRRDSLPIPLKWGAQEMITHIANEAQELLFLRIDNKKVDGHLQLQKLEKIAPKKYWEYYGKIMI